MGWYSFYFRHAILIFRIVIIFVLYFISIDVWLIYVYISQFTKLGFNTRQARYTKENYRYWRTKKPDLLNLRQFFHPPNTKILFYNDYLLCHTLKGVYWSNIFLIVHFMKEVGKWKRVVTMKNILEIDTFCRAKRHFFYIKRPPHNNSYTLVKAKNQILLR